MSSLSLLEQYRLNYQPKLPISLRDISSLSIQRQENLQKKESPLHALFPQTSQQSIIHFHKGTNRLASPLKVGVVLSGGQASGGHNVISGLFDALKKLNSESRLIGFCGGPSGIINNNILEIDEALLASYRNQGGFDIIGSGRTKIETDAQFATAEANIRNLDLDGLVIIGGDDSNTNAAFLAEYFKKKEMKTRVVGVPKTIDGDLKNELIEVSFGFDTACKIYSEIIGNILKDTLSAKKSYYFIRLMGRSASHITLECAFQTHANMALIGEEIEAKNQSLDDVVNQIANMICIRASKGKNYGAILIPEGIIEFIPDFKQMIQEINRLVAANKLHERERLSSIQQMLNQESAACFLSLPEEIQSQLLLDRDPHGNIQVSKIETERLFITLIEKELRKRAKEGRYSGKFASQPLFCGYEGRSGLPSNFDCQYCYALGHVAALLVHLGLTGYMSCVKNLTQPVESWNALGVPIVDMLHLEEREGKNKAVIRKALVDLNKPPFQIFSSLRERWLVEDDYCCPGPIQFDGPSEITEACSFTLTYEKVS